MIDPITGVNFKSKKIFGVRTSNKEIRDMLVSWGAISLAFTILLSNRVFDPIKLISLFIISAIAVGLGFLLHEFAHKVVAQRYRCWAEFRSNDSMLMFAVVLSFAGFIFAAPGAVMIIGRVTRDQNGKISIAGPATNFILAIIFLLVALTGIPFLSQIGIYGFIINTWIGLFNMIPFLNFDGKKILAWSPVAYFGLLGLGATLFILQKII